MRRFYKRRSKKSKRDKENVLIVAAQSGSDILSLIQQGWLCCLKTGITG